jgi:hypothetical protein
MGAQSIETWAPKFCKMEPYGIWATRPFFNAGGDVKIVSWLPIEWKNTNNIGKLLVVAWLIAITAFFCAQMKVHTFYEYFRPRLIVGWVYIWSPLQQNLWAHSGSGSRPSV